MTRRVPGELVIESGLMLHMQETGEADASSVNWGSQKEVSCRMGEERSGRETKGRGRGRIEGKGGGKFGGDRRRENVSCLEESHQIREKPGSSA